MTVPTIAVADLRRSFAGREVLRGVSADVRQGEVFAMVGVNGSGKSTLIEILATLLLPTSGRATVAGFDVVQQASDVRRLVGYCPSNPQTFYPRLTGRRNLAFFAALYEVDVRVAERRIDSLLERVGLADASHARVERYSDGMKARLSIARALLTDAPVLLLDEPTKSLDPAARDMIRPLILGEGPSRAPRTIVWVTHDLKEAAEVADRIGVIEDGRLRE
jgi:ABC-2 type transport system ATP-binding protein